MKSNTVPHIRTLPESDEVPNQPHIRNRYGEIESLPLSWLRNDARLPWFHLVKLPVSKNFWLPFANIPQNYTFEMVFDTIFGNLPSDLIIRGCDARIAGFLEKKGWETIQMGVEAVLDLQSDKPLKPSLQELVRRGRKKGSVCDVGFSEETAAELERLRNYSAHGRKPQLQFLFRSVPDRNHRCFAFRTSGGKWLAALTLSRNSTHTFHTELMLRRHDAPVGVMEALIAAVMERMKAEKIRFLSLGEVPFVSLTPPHLGKTFLLNRVGRFYKFAYNYEGVFYFKNKFEPDWRPLYVCARPTVNMSVLSGLFFRSGCYRLAKHKIGENVNTCRNYLAAALAQVFVP